MHMLRAAKANTAGATTHNQAGIRLAARSVSFEGEGRRARAVTGEKAAGT
jgi:hypothetical protein